MSQYQNSIPVGNQKYTNPFLHRVPIIISSIFRYSVAADRNGNLGIRFNGDPNASVSYLRKQSIKNSLIRAFGTWAELKNLATLKSNAF